MLSKLEQPAPLSAAVEAENTNLNEHHGHLFAVVVPVESTRSPTRITTKLFNSVVAAPMLWLGHSVTSKGGVLQALIAIIMLFTLFLTVTNSVGKAAVSLAAGCMTARGADAAAIRPPVFHVDSGAGEHVLNDLNYFQDLDTSRSKRFRVVHDKTVSSQGVGTVELAALDVDGEWCSIVLNGVHYL